MRTRGAVRKYEVSLGEVLPRIKQCVLAMADYSAALWQEERHVAESKGRSRCTSWLRRAKGAW